jgi:transcriptional regulator with XRE-family HTH domain
MLAMHMARSRRSPDPSPATLGEAVRRARKDARGWTQVELAAALGVDQATVSKWERGENSPDHVTIMRIESTLELPRGQILTWAGFVSSGVEGLLPYAAERGRRKRPSPR